MDTSALIYPFPNRDDRSQTDKRSAKTPVYFLRDELQKILNVYGRRVASGEWRDYAIDMGSSTASFLIYRRTSEAPLYRIIKDPTLARKQGQWRIVAMDGRVLKRGHDLATTLKTIDTT